MTDVWSRWTALWNGDAAAGDGLFTDDCAIHFGGVAGNDETDALRGAEIAEFIGKFRTLYESLGYRTEIGPIESPDYIAGRWNADAVRDGTSFVGAGHDILQVTGDQISHVWSITGTRRF